jgi:phage FluMu protein Com
MIPNELHVSKEDQIKLDISKQETINLRQRDLRCPNCKYLITKLYSDISGHMQFKCPKCKEVYVLNLALFRTRNNSLYVTLIKVIE